MRKTENENEDMKGEGVSAKKVTNTSTSKTTVAKATKKKVSKKKLAAKKVAGNEGPSSSVSRDDAVKDSSVSAQKNAAQENDRAGASGLLKIALTASLLALLVAAYAAYQFTLSSRVAESQLAAIDERLKFVVLEQQNLQAEFNSQRQQDQDKLKQFGAALADAQSLVGEIQLTSQASSDDIKANLGDAVARWKLDEVHSLLTRVNRAYQLSGDPMQAINGLMLVQTSLAVIDNPRLDAVKTALAEDILRIKSDRNIDVSALHDQLSAMRTIVPDLALEEDTRRSDTTDSSDLENPSNADDAESGLFAAGKSLFSDIGSLVKHKNLDVPLQPSLDTEARYVVYESLKLTLQGAMLALLQRDNPSYQTQLKIANTSLQAYFDTAQGDAKTIAEQLQVLMTYDVSLESKAGSKALSELNRVLLVEN